MQISKTLTFGCAALVALITISANAADTPAQIKAREALRQKLNETPAPAPAPAPAPKAVEATPAPKKATVQPVPSSGVLIKKTPKTVTKEDEKAVKEKLKAAEKAAKEKAKADEKLAKEKAKADEKLAKEQAKKGGKTSKETVKFEATPTPAAAPAPAVTPAPAATRSSDPFAGFREAAVAEPNSKSARLAALLESYKADKLSPTEYHAQRAKILAEP